jgi:hypothetical protein
MISNKQDRERAITSSKEERALLLVDGLKAVIRLCGLLLRLKGANPCACASLPKRAENLGVVF